MSFISNAVVFLLLFFLTLNYSRQLYFYFLYQSKKVLSHLFWIILLWLQRLQQVNKQTVVKFKWFTKIFYKEYNHIVINKWPNQWFKHFLMNLICDKAFTSKASKKNFETAASLLFVVHFFAY